MSFTFVAGSLAYLAYQWYNLKEKRIRIVLTPKKDVNIHDHTETIASMFSSGRLKRTMGLAGYLSVSSHIETMDERAVVTVDVRYRWKITWDIGTLFLQGFDIQCSEIYDR